MTNDTSDKPLDVPTPFFLVIAFAAVLLIGGLMLADFIWVAPAASTVAAPVAPTQVTPGSVPSAQPLGG